MCPITNKAQAWALWQSHQLDLRHGTSGLLLGFTHLTVHYKGRCKDVTHLRSGRTISRRQNRLNVDDGELEVNNATLRDAHKTNKNVAISLKTNDIKINGQQKQFSTYCTERHTWRAARPDRSHAWRVRDVGLRTHHKTALRHADESAYTCGISH